MRNPKMIIDAWEQHPNLRHTRDPSFDSLRRCSREEAPTVEIPLATTIRAMDAAGVAKALIPAWVTPHNVMISNDRVPGLVGDYRKADLRQDPDRPCDQQQPTLSADIDSCLASLDG